MQSFSKRQRPKTLFKKNKFFASNPAPMSVPMIVSSHAHNRSGFTGARRPVDKELVVISKNGVNATQVSTTLVTATFPCTIVGLRWDMSMLVDAGTGPGAYSWAIVILRDGVTISQMSQIDGAALYAPEQDVMSYGMGIMQQVDIGSGHYYSGNTKTMRKLMGGDKLMFIYKGEATNTTACKGTIQFFCKI